MFVYYNPNPAGHSVGDCVIRAICRATGESWDKIYVELAVTGMELADMPSADAVSGKAIRGQRCPTNARRVIP